MIPPDTVRVVDTITIRMVDTVFVGIQQGHPGLVERLTDWSTIIVGITAIIALGVPFLELRRKRRSADARIGAEAFTLRRTLRGW